VISVRSTAVAVTVLLLAMAVPAGAEAAPSAAEQTASDQTASRAMWVRDLRASGMRCRQQTCWDIKRHLRPLFDVVFEDGLRNAQPRRAELRCEVNRSVTRTYSVSAEVSGEVSAGIFASVSATVKGGMSRSMTSSVGVRVTTNVPAWTETSCQRGIFVERFKVRLCRYAGGGQYCSRINVKGPSGMKWRFKDTRIRH